MTPGSIKESRWYDAFVYGAWFTLGTIGATYLAKKVANWGDDDEETDELAEVVEEY